MYRVYRALGLNLRIKPRKRPVRVKRALEQVIAWRGKLVEIRCDNGPEYISEELKRWAHQQDIALRYIQPGNPQQNAYIERFNRTVRYDWLGH